MSEVIKYLSTLFQLNSALGVAMLLILLMLLGAAAYRLTFSKHIAANGQVLFTRKPNGLFNRLFLKRQRHGSKRKSITRKHRRWLRIIYAVYEALLGLIIFAFGLALLTRVYIGLMDDTQNSTEPMMVMYGLLGLISLPVGVLLIYFRDTDNPFDESR